LHEWDSFRTGVRISLLSERDVGVKPRIIRTGHFGGSLYLQIDEGKGRYVDESKRRKSPVLSLILDE